ncbi:MAG TPA: hypothetical protein VIR56_02595 [Solimonas sp.]
MRKRIAISALALLAVAAATAVQAGAPPLTADQLRQCAAQVQQLRRDATRLNAATPQLDARRAALDQRSAALQREATTLDRDDLHASLDLQQRRKQHNDEALAFNAEIARHKQAIEAVNVVKQQYAANCADRAYRRADFTQLAPDAQAAMHAGLDDIEVPYLDPTVR